MQRADSYSYYENSSIKNHGLYGNHFNIITSVGSEIMSLGMTLIDQRENIVNINVKGMEDDQIMETIANWITQNLNTNFDLEQYELNKTIQTDKTIYDITLLLLGEIKTSIGYTIFVSDDKITAIYDNTKGNKVDDLVSENMINKVSLFDQRSNVMRVNNSIDLKQYNINSQKAYKYYDDKDGKIYLVVSSVLEDRMTTARFVNVNKVLID